MRPIRFAGSMPGCLAIVDCSLVYDLDANEYLNRSRIKYLDLNTFSLHDTEDLPSTPPTVAGSSDPFETYGFRPLYERLTASTKTLTYAADPYNSKFTNILASSLGLEKLYRKLGDSFVEVELGRDIVSCGFFAKKTD